MEGAPMLDTTTFVGLDVHAKSARIGIIDKLFSRVGAADDLARG